MDNYICNTCGEIDDCICSSSLQERDYDIYAGGDWELEDYAN